MRVRASVLNSLHHHDRGLAIGVIARAHIGRFELQVLVEPLCAGVGLPHLQRQKGYVPLARDADGDVDAADLARQVRALATRFDDDARLARSRIASVARDAVASLTWDNQLSRVIASVTRRG